MTPFADTAYHGPDASTRGPHRHSHNDRGIGKFVRRELLAGQQAANAPTPHYALPAKALTPN